MIGPGPDQIERWRRAAQIVAFVALAWAVFVPGVILWTVAASFGVIGRHFCPDSGDGRG